MWLNHRTVPVAFRWLAAIPVDLAVFFVALHLGIPWDLAHLAGFVAGSLVTFLLWMACPARGPRRGSTGFNPWVYWFVQLAGIFARGGVLAASIERGGVEPEIAIIFAVAASAAVGILGGLLWPLTGEPAPGDTGRIWRIRFTALAGYAVFLRLIYSGTVELLYEEAYYWNYAQHLDVGYLDHPPMVGWLIWFFTRALGPSEFSVRLGALLCWAVAACFAYRLALALRGKGTASATLLLVALLPFYFGVGLFMTPDAPLAACWAATLFYLFRAIVEERRAAWLGAGIFMGLGMLSKYTISLLGIATIVFILLERRARGWWRRPELYASAAIAALVFSPVVIWNARHEWISFAFQGPLRAAGQFAFDLPKLIGFVLILLTPIGLLTAGLSLGLKSAVFGRGEDPETSRARPFLVCTVLVPLLVFLSFSLFRETKLNWTGPIWTGILPYMALFIDPARLPGKQAWQRLSRKAWLGTILILPVLYGIGLYYLSLGFPTVPYPRNLLGIGIRDLADRIEAVSSAWEGKTGEMPMVVCIDTNKMASWIAFYRVMNALSHGGGDLGSIVQNTTGGHLFGKNSLMYRFWHPTGLMKGRDLLLVAETRDHFGLKSVRVRTRPLGPIQRIVLKKNGKISGRYYYRMARQRIRRRAADSPFDNQNRALAFPHDLF